MLCVNLSTGEYVVINDNIVVQLYNISGNRCRMMVTAPREIPIVRGEVLEREGGERPGCVIDGPFDHRSEIPWNKSKSQSLVAMRKLLSRMDSWDINVQTLRRQLNNMFPPVPDSKTAEQITQVSPG